MLSFPKSCRRAVLCAALLVVPLVAASEGAVAPLEQAASSTTTTIGRNEALARFAGCADDVVRTSFADGAEPLQSTARAVFWGCVFYGGWPDGELTDDLSHHEKLVDSILAGAALDSAVTLTLDLAEAPGSDHEVGHQRHKTPDRLLRLGVRVRRRASCDDVCRGRQSGRAGLHPLQLNLSLKVQHPGGGRRGAGPGRPPHPPRAPGRRAPPGGGHRVRVASSVRVPQKSVAALSCSWAVEPENVNVELVSVTVPRVRNRAS